MAVPEIIRTNRKTISITVTRDCRVVVRAPVQTPQHAIDDFLHTHTAWIEHHLSRMEKRRAFDVEHFSDPQRVDKLILSAREYLPGRTEYWANKMGVHPTSIRISRAKSRFGSCSAKDVISYSYRIMVYPDNVIDYLIVHELAHIRHKNHSAAFYGFISEFLPDHRYLEAQLKQK